MALFPMKTDILYWSPKELRPGEKREIGFSYGLGSVASSGNLRLTIAGNLAPNGELNVVAEAFKPQPGQKVKLKLPEGFTLADGQLEQPVPPAGADGRPSPITWRVRAGSNVGTFDIEVTSQTPQGATETVKKKVVIKTAPLF
jgi:hypothetical protein